MKKYLAFFLEFLFIASIVLVIYVSTIDLFIFNRYFLQIPTFRWLFYLMPILLSFLFLLLAVLLKNKIRLLSLIFTVLSNIYLALSIFMISGIYCEEEKNLKAIHIVIVILVTLLLAGIHYKKLLPKVSKFDLALISLVTFSVMVELYLNLFSYDLIYVNLMSFAQNIVFLRLE